jgi:hypothetical protein
MSSLTPLSKILLALAVVGLIGGVLYYISSNPELANKVAPGMVNNSKSGGNASTASAPGRTANNDVLVVAMNT